MVGLDTNVLLRWLLKSDEPEDVRQARLSAKALGGGDFYVGQVVLVEMVWTLRRRYGLDRAAIAAVLGSILSLPQAIVERRSITEQAVDAYSRGGPGFADHLLGHVHIADGCKTTLTFDKAAARGDHFTLLD